MDNKVLLEELKLLLNENFPGMLDKIILYGSRARDVADESSDYDILLVINRDFDWKLERQIQDVCWEIDCKYDILTDVKIISLNDLNHIRGKQPFILNALNEGISA
jgi:predicted nucleotidyltransferase